MLENSELFDSPPPAGRVFCNRTLNLRSIKAIGFDMDYTLIHYHIDAWESRAYEHARQQLLLDYKWPLEQCSFDIEFSTRGLVIDREKGNIIKADRFGYVRRATHGTKRLSFGEHREIYGHELVSLRQNRWAFMNTLFSLSKACLYAQCVDLLDEGKISDPIGYGDLHTIIGRSVDEAHMMGRLKAEVAADPDVFVDLDPTLPQALLDLKNAGKKLLLITNAEWTYTHDMMTYAFDRFLPENLKTWRDLFDVIIVEARKPKFFSGRNPIFEVVDEQGHLKTVRGPLREGAVYLGGDAAAVEEYLGLSGAGGDTLYVGDHISTDVTISKQTFRWRTALIIRELEAELEAQERFQTSQNQLTTMMAEKERLERGQARLRLEYQRSSGQKLKAIKASLADLKHKAIALDDQIAPLAKAAAELGHPYWGPLMRTGNDKSHLARQIERYADVYTSRVSNLGLITPFAYLRAPRSSLPHDSFPEERR